LTVKSSVVSSSDALRSVLLVSLVLLVASFVSACQPAGRVFQATLGPADRPLPVSLTDETGLIVGLEAVAMNFTTWTDTPPLRGDPADGRAAILSFLGGMCDQDAKLAFRLHEGVYELRLNLQEKLGLGCPAAGVMRSVRLVTSEPIPVATVLVVGD